MTVAFDLRPLQIGHQFRGIGICQQNILKRLQKNTQHVKHWELVFYVYKDKPLPSILESYTLPYRVIEVTEILSSHNRFKLVRYPERLFASWRRTNAIDRLPEIKKIDIFVQFDFLLGVPSHPHIKKILLKYDIIPLVLENFYLPTFGQVRNRTKSIRLALKAHKHRLKYLWLLRKALQRSDEILAISEHTKRDLVHYLKADEKKIKVLYLGADDTTLEAADETEEEKRFWCIDWRLVHSQKRYISFSLADKPYILYIGGADIRRRIQDLVLAYNLLRSRGVDCKLLLAGFDFQDLETVPNEEVREAILYSSYSDGIHLLGFVDSRQKALLYQYATAFVFPTQYEGFGLPILEAMEHGCPVICYNNSSLKEVGGSAALYAESPENIAEILKKLTSTPDFREEVVQAGYKQVKKFSWQKTSSQFITLINNV